MIRPTSLIRGDDEATSPRIEANASNIRKESLDCGITAIGCCNTPKCQKLGTAKSFLIILIFIAIAQGAAERYFFLSAKQAVLEYGFHPAVLDWLLVSSGIFQGLFAVFVAYWGNRIHRISWLGGILIFQAIACFMVVIPILSNNDTEYETITAHHVELLCIDHITGELTVEQPHFITTLILFFFVQFLTALGNIAFQTLALSYLDDNVLEHESPAIIGAALAARYWGMQWGSALAFGIARTSFGWWLGWTIISPILFILAILISLFPKRLLKTVVRQAADNIIEEATNSSQLSLSPNKLLADISFASSMKRMLTNKILMFNVIASVFIEIAMVNYLYHEQNYLQSRFLLPSDDASGGSNEWTSRILTTMLKPPLVALSILVAALIIAKANPSPRKLAAWNIITATIVALIFVAYIFIDCTHNPIAGAYNGKLIKPYCSRTCLCDEDIRFTPVCPEDSVQTFYSPCHAGCATSISFNGQTIYSNCTCGVDSELPTSDAIATEGACGYLDCQKLWIIFQVLTVAAASLLGSGIIGNLLISLRSVLPQDKSLALSMELWLIGLIVYIPGKIGYQVIADATCQYWSQDNFLCYLHENPVFGNTLNIVSIILISIGIFFDILVFIFVKDLILYGDEPEDSYRPIPMQEYRTNPYNNQHSQFYASSQDAAPHEAFVPEQLNRNIPDNQNNNRSASPLSDSTLPIAANVRSVQQQDNNPTYATIQSPTSTEELNFHLQTPNHVSPTSPVKNRLLFGSDINPSVGDISDRESDLNIRQLESSVSSLSGVNGNSASPPMRTRYQTDQRRQPLSPETDF